MLASVLVLLCGIGGLSAQQPVATTLPKSTDIPAIIEVPASKVLAAEKGVLPPGTPRWLDPEVVLVQARGPAPLGPARGDDAQTAYKIPFDLPGSERLFRIESEEALFQRMSQEARERKPEELVFPEEPVLSKEPYYGRGWKKTMNMKVEPHFVCHGRLEFEQINSERYGWEFGVLQPVISTLNFYKDVALMPFHYFTQPCRTYDCSSGKCLPGDPVPLLIYPPEFTVTGIAAEAASISALFAIFP
jgi:hypothetical protein